MKTSDSIAKIAPAFLAAQRNIGAALKGQKNPFFKSTYADLGDVMEACKEQLNEQGIAVLQPVGSDGEATYVETILLHESGEYFSEKMRVEITGQSEKAAKEGKEYNKTQAQGSAITYARRYSLQSLVFIPAEDDDANKATSTSKSSQEPQRTPQNPKSTTKPTSIKNTPPQASADVPAQSALKTECETLNVKSKDGVAVTWPMFVAKALQMKTAEAAQLLASRDLEYAECAKVDTLLQQYRNIVTQSQSNVA